METMAITALCTAPLCWRALKIEQVSAHAEKKWWQRCQTSIHNHSGDRNCHRGMGRPKNTWKWDLDTEIWTTDFRYSDGESSTMYSLIEINNLWHVCSIGGTRLWNLEWRPCSHNLTLWNGTQWRTVNDINRVSSRKKQKLASLNFLSCSIF